MESIEALRKLLQEEKVRPAGWSRPWGYRLFQRGPSIYITRALLHFSVTPNQATVASLLLGLAGCLLVFQFSWYFKLAGLVLLYLNVLTDKVDGEIARYRKTFSLKGIYLDEINHLVVPPLFWTALVFGITKIYFFEVRYLFAAGFLGALSLAINRIVHSLAPQIYAKKYIKHRELFSLPQRNVTNASGEPRRFSKFKKMFRWFNQFQDFFVLITTTAIVLVAETMLRLDAVFHPFLASFVIVMSILQFLFVLENIFKGVCSIEHDIEKISQS